MFGTSKEAAQAYDHAAIQAGHQASKLNFPELMPIEDQPDDDLPMLKSKKPKKVNPGKRTTKRKRAAENISPYPTGILFSLQMNIHGTHGAWCMCWCVVGVLLMCCWCVVVVVVVVVLWWCCCCGCCGCCGGPLCVVCLLRVLFVKCCVDCWFSLSTCLKHI